MTLHLVTNSSHFGFDRDSVTYAKLEAVVVLEIADLLVEVIVLLGPSKVGTRHKATIAGQRKPRLKNESLILFGFFNRRSLVDKEYCRVPRSLGHKASAFTLGNRSKHDAKGQAI